MASCLLGAGHKSSGHVARARVAEELIPTLSGIRKNQLLGRIGSLSFPNCKMASLQMVSSGTQEELPDNL